MSLLHLLPWQWVMLTVGAFCIGLSKTGIPGLGILGVAVSANALAGNHPNGAIVPLLICGDVLAVVSYRRHGNWWHLVRLFPWAGLGLLLGTLAVKRIDAGQLIRLIGGVLIVMVALQFVQRARARRASAEQEGDSEPGPRSESYRFWYAAAMGVAAGFATMVGNAAGPILMMYLISAGLPKIEFIGTSAWFYFVLNLVKMPLNSAVGQISAASLGTDLLAAPAVLVGGLYGRYLLPRIDQSVFDTIALLLTLVAALRLVFG